MKAKRYALKASSPMHSSKNRVYYHLNFYQTFMLTGNQYFLSIGGTVLTIVLPTQKNFVISYLVVYDCTGMEGSCMATDISITSASCNHKNCKPRSIYKGLKFPNCLFAFKTIDYCCQQMRGALKTCTVIKYIM